MKLMSDLKKNLTKFKNSWNLEFRNLEPRPLGHTSLVGSQFQVSYFHIYYLFVGFF
jgi:hypothetical protein